MHARYLVAVSGFAASLAALACGPAKPAEGAADEGNVVTATPGNSDTPPGVAPTPPPASISLANPPGSGVPYDKESVEIGLKRAARQVKANCGLTTDESGKPTGPWGKTTVTVTLGHNGHSQTTVVSAPFDGRPVGKCISQAFVGLTYPPFAGGDTTVEWPVEVVEPVAPPAAPAPARHH